MARLKIATDPSLVLKQLKIVTAPSLVLKQRANKVTSVDDEIRELMDSMLVLMLQSNGVGLAANQVGITKQVLVIDLQDNDEVNRGPDFYPLFMANPEILESSSESKEDSEGCLSLPEQQVTLTRPQALKVKYIDYHNEEQILFADGWLARAIQHEMDHLNGILLIDYLSPLKKDSAIRKLKKLASSAYTQA